MSKQIKWIIIDNKKRNPNITKIYIENGQPPFLVIVDELNSKYRYDKANKETVSLEDLGKESKKWSMVKIILEFSNKAV